MANTSGISLNLGTGVVTGIITGAVSVRFALRRFRAERTWERKVSAYTEIFDALYNIQRHAKMRLEEIEEGATFVKEYEAETNRLASQAYDSIRRAAIKGTFFVGPAAAARLERLVTVFDRRQRGEDMHDEVSADFAAAKSALVDLRTIANADVYDSNAFNPRRIREYFFARSARPIVPRTNA